MDAGLDFPSTLKAMQTMVDASPPRLRERMETLYFLARTRPRYLKNYATIRMWRSYIFDVSPSLAAVSWPAANWCDGEPWACHDERYIWGGSRRYCMCGCGIKAFPFAHDVHNSHEMVWRRAFVRCLRLEQDPKDITRKALNALRDYSPMLFTSDEERLLKTLHQRAKVVSRLSPSTFVQIPGPRRIIRGQALADALRYGDPQGIGIRFPGVDRDKEAPE